MKITVVGVGALGSHVIQNIRNLDCEIVAIDDDKVEAKNLLSQFHGKTTLRKNKAVGLKQTMNFMWHRMIKAVPTRLTTDNQEQLLGSSALVIDCLDNAESRLVVSAFCRKHKIPCLHGALSADGKFGRAIWDKYFVPDEAAPGAATCEDGAFLPFITLTAARIAQAAQLFVEEGQQVGFQIAELETIRI